VRIIAGRLGGRRLAAPRGLDTRPTSDRVREALFSTLGPLAGAAVLDIYAGTGALGIEALSRGAKRASFVESARPALAVLRENLASLGLAAEARVIAQPARRAIATIVQQGPFDLLLLDPPYAELAEVAPLCASLNAQGALAPGARVVIEHAKRDTPPEIERLLRSETRTYGDTALTFYERA